MVVAQSLAHQFGGPVVAGARVRGDARDDERHDFVGFLWISFFKTRGILGKKQRRF